MARAKQHGCEIVLPHDFVVAKELKAGAECQVCDVGNIPPDEMILDMGPKSVADLKRRFAEMKTLVWNGPLGAFEFEPFGNGTFELMREAARLAKDGKLVAIAGGGDTVAALNIAGVGWGLHLCVHGRRRLPRMAGGQDPACRCRAGREQSLKDWRYIALSNGDRQAKPADHERGSHGGPLGARRHHHRSVHPLGRLRAARRGGARHRRRRLRLDPCRCDGRALRAEHHHRPRRGEGAPAALEEDRSTCI